LHISRLDLRQIEIGADNHQENLAHLGGSEHASWLKRQELSENSALLHFKVSLPQPLIVAKDSIQFLA
jgi:hypothetical protein